MSTLALVAAAKCLRAASNEATLVRGFHIHILHYYQSGIIPEHPLYWTTAATQFPLNLSIDHELVMRVPPHGGGAERSKHDLRIPREPGRAPLVGNKTIIR